MTTGVPVLCMAEILLKLADEEQERHWTAAACWCSKKHDGSETGLILVAAPWTEERVR